jgi:hypothetical protein
VLEAIEVQTSSASLPEEMSLQGSNVEPPRRAGFSPVLLFGGGGIALLLLLFMGWYFLNYGRAAAAPPTETPAPTETSAPTAAAEVGLVANTEAPTQATTQTPTVEPTATNTLPPLYVRINNISVNDNNFYVVEYETFGYTEVLPGQHIHFFFDTVPVEQAGSPGTGKWYLYGGPRPFDEYRLNDRPVGATQMCALVANPNHSIIPETGNCVDLP